MILVDTNLLLRASRTDNSHHPMAIEALADVLHLGYKPCVVPQVLYEYWVVVTRPLKDNGYGMSTAEAEQEIDWILGQCELMHEQPGLFEEWRRLVVAYDVKGKPAHDTRLVAAMIQNKIPLMMSFNHRDFQRFGEIASIHPTDSSTLPELT